MAVLFTRRIDAALTRVARAATFVVQVAGWALRPPYPIGETLRQCYEVGLRTLPLVTLTGIITGIVFTTQSRPSLASFGATSWLPSLVTVALVRSLAPLVTALVSAGKVGSSIGAELGSMRVTEQIDAMEVSAVHPVKYLVVTRTLATTLMVPALTLYFGFVGLVGSFLNVSANEGTSVRSFLADGFATLEMLDLGAAMFKATLFGFTIGIVSCFAGYTASGGTRGVGRAANLAVVQSMLAVFLEEVFVVQIVAWIRSGAWRWML